jgi:hypothetical protein
MTTSDLEDDRQRERIAFGRRIDWESEARLGTVFFGPEKSRQFPPLPVGTAKSLLERGYVDAGARHNEAPPAGELVEWAESVQTRFKAHQFEVGLIGYMVSPHRSDARVALEGVSVRSPGPIPTGLKREVAKRFDPALLTVDDFYVELRWD